MIICPTQRFVFLHIPKCAGSSVRRQILGCDPDHIELGRVGRHEDLGRIDYGHIPLDLLRQHFPDYNTPVRNLDAFAILRDPYARFGSALRQVLWRYEKRHMTLIPPDELREMTLRMLDRVAVEIETPSHQLIFFIRQGRFVFDEGRQVAQHLIPLDLVPDFIAYLSRRTGTEMEPEARANQNVDLKVKGRLGALAFRANHLLWTMLPAGLHREIKTAALRVLSTDQSAAEAGGIQNLSEVRDFVTEYYAEDIRLYDTVMARRAEIAEGLAQNDLAQVVSDLTSLPLPGQGPAPHPPQAPS